MARTQTDPETPEPEPHEPEDVHARLTRLEAHERDVVRLLTEIVHYLRDITHELRTRR